MTVKDTKKTRRKYDSAFKEEVLKMVALGRPVPKIAQKLGIGENLVYRWKREAEGRKASENGPVDRPHPIALPEALAEIERLSAALKQSETERLRAEQDREILKKVFGILGRGM